MNYKLLLLIITVSLLLGAGMDHYLNPTIKNTETTKEVIKNNIVTVTHEVKEKDGTIDTTTTVTDTSQKTDTSKSTQVIILPKPNWLVSATYNTDIHTLQPSYGADVKRRILGPIFLGANADTSGRIGLTLGMEF